FMRRMGSAALTSTGPVLNVLPLAVHIDARETLADLAMRLAAQQGQASGELFSAIEGNYADAVRLLTTAHSAKFDGKATLFVAEKTRQEGMDPQVVWGPWVGELEVFSQNCAHVDIISPQAFEAIGPVVREILG
uniref:thioesterase domain-containing protein n=1 Tax=Klebsiella pneumoniae TaxID=573 RepID=UPI003C7912A9